MKEKFDIINESIKYAEKMIDGGDDTDEILIQRHYEHGAACMCKEVKKQLHILVGAMILDGYDEYDSCVKYINEYIKEL